jgi:hypothetical protein
MRFDAYYACKGKPALQSNDGLEPDLVEILTDRMLFKHSEGGVTIWTHDDDAAVVKLLIVAYFKRHYPDEFFKAAPVSVEFFDQWWTLERYDGLENDLDVIVDDLPPELISSFTSTGMELVDAWITDLKDGKRYKSPITVHLPTGFMVLWNQRLVGYIQDASWHLPFLRGKWNPIKNVVTAEFLTKLGTGRETEVVISGGPDLRGPVTIEGDRISIRMCFANGSGNE